MAMDSASGVIAHTEQHVHVPVSCSTQKHGVGHRWERAAKDAAESTALPVLLPGFTCL